jgi:hypothetical protein
MAGLRAVSMTRSTLAWSWLSRYFSQVQKIEEVDISLKDFQDREVPFILESSFVRDGCRIA